MSVIAEQYAHTFRIWPMRQDKTPIAPGFGAEHPNAAWNPKLIKDGSPVGILCGPLARGAAEGYHVIGLDLDHEMDRTKLEDALGPLPETLTSKGWHHAYYLIPDDHPLHQRNKAITCPGGALDIRPTAGGYLIEKGDWDRGFDPALMAVLPDEAIARLARFIGEKRSAAGEPHAVAPVQLSDRDAEIARDLASLWQHDTKGDRAFGGLGGWLARRGVSRDRAEAIAGRVAELANSTHADPIERVAQAYDDGSCPLGRPALQQALSENAEEALVQVVLDDLEAKVSASIADFKPEPAIADQPGKRHGLRVLSGDALRVELPNVQWLCRDLQLAPGRPPVLAATANAGKSWSLQCLAMSVCRGEPVFGRFPVQTRGPVVHVCTDAGERATLRKYQQIARAMKCEIPENLYVLPDRITGLVDKYGSFRRDGLKDLDAIVTEVDARLVMLDSMFAIVAGLDMNSPNAGDPLYATKDDSRVWLWAMHVPRAGGAYFGSAAIGAAAGAMWTIEKSELDENRIWTCTKRSEDFEGGTPAPFATTWETHQNEDGILDAGQIIYVEDREQAQTQPDRVEDARARILAALQKDAATGLSSGQMYEVSQPLRRELFLDVLKSLVDSGAVRRTKAGRAFVYRPGAS